VELIVLIVLATAIVWIIWKVLAYERALDSTTLDQAWKIVIADPHYKHRREYEEHKHEMERQLRDEAKRL
jgi:ABC-type nickel/cobalt efflux system permease component RcnA